MAYEGGPAAQKAFYRSYAFGPLNTWTLVHSAICLLVGAILWF